MTEDELNARPSAYAMVKAVKAYAAEHYGDGATTESKGGWDYVLETMNDMDIVNIIWGATTVKGAIWKMSRHLAPLASVRRDIQGA